MSQVSTCALPAPLKHSELVAKRTHIATTQVPQFLALGSGQTWDRAESGSRLEATTPWHSGTLRAILEVRVAAWVLAAWLRQNLGSSWSLLWNSIDSSFRVASCRSFMSAARYIVSRWCSPWASLGNDNDMILVMQFSCKRWEWSTKFLAKDFTLHFHSLSGPSEC